MRRTLRRLRWLLFRWTPWEKRRIARDKAELKRYADSLGPITWDPAKIPGSGDRQPLSRHLTYHA